MYDKSTNFLKISSIFGEYFRLVFKRPLKTRTLSLSLVIFKRNKLHERTLNRIKQQTILKTY